MRPRRPPLAYSDERIAAVNSGRRAGAPLAERVERRAGDGGGLRGGHPRGLALPPRPRGRGLPGTRAPPAELGRDPAPGGGSPKRVRAGCGGCSSKRRLMLRLRDPRTATLREWAGRLHPPRQGYRCGRARARLAGILFALLHDGTVRAASTPCLPRCAGRASLTESELLPRFCLCRDVEDPRANLAAQHIGRLERPLPRRIVQGQR